MATSNGSPRHDLRSPLLDQALQRYRTELKFHNDFLLGADGIEELLREARNLEAKHSRKNDPSVAVGRLEPILSQLNNFAAIMALCFGASAETAALVWGSVRMILSLASSTQDVLNDILDMLEEISLSLPRFTNYEKTLPLDEAFKSSLIDAYREMTLFCARTINFFRSHPHSPLIRASWPQLSNDFQRTIKRLKRLSQSVEREAEAARMRLEGEKNNEILSLMKAFQDASLKKDVLPIYHMPLGLNEKILGREAEIRKIHDSLDPNSGIRESKSLALYGMGGVGKTAIALRYANSSRDFYDAIFWISADNMIKMTQDFLEIAHKLELVPKDRRSEDSNMAMVRVKAWLNETDCRWLVVFDNADDLEILIHAWPGSAPGSILLTSRDFTAGFTPAATGLFVQPFDEATGSAAFLELIGQSEPSPANIDLAREISHRLGGLPLALRQISGFVVKQRLSLKDFLPLYERNAAKIHAKKTGPSDYRYNLSTVWGLALGQLTGYASSLQKLLTFFDPDRIDEAILTTNGVTLPGSGEFEFLKDELDFLDAKEVLLRAALIDRTEDACISVHRLVQGVVMDDLATIERGKYLEQAIELLGSAFPCPWKYGPGYTFTSWNKCEMCLPHVHFLVAQAKKYSINANNRDMFVELLLRCCWYLYESERCHEGLPLAHLALEILQDETSLTYAQGIDILGLLWLDTNHPRKALECFHTCWDIRKKTLPRNDPFTAVALNHVSLAYTELRDFPQAAGYQQQAINIRLEIDSPLIGNSYSNMSSILLGMGKPDEAEQMLMRCPSLKDMNDESFLRTDNPRFSSDMVLLSRIRVCQGRLDDALRLRSKALAFRQRIYGDKYKTCDSLYQIADLLYIRGDCASAINLLEKSITILEGLTESEGFIARAYFKLSEIYIKLGSDSEAQKRHREAALHYRLKAHTDLSPGQEFSEENFNLLVPWMMW